jgi:hypothetical protein
LINALAENLSSLELNATNILLVLFNLLHEISRNQENNDDEESDQNLYLELSFLDKCWQSNTNCEGKLSSKYKFWSLSSSSLFS